MYLTRQIHASAALLFKNVFVTFYI